MSRATTAEPTSNGQTGSRRFSILAGAQTGRGGVLTQCAVEEAFGLRLGIKGLTSYAETLSVYGTERSFVDGDDTPWSKAFLAAAVYQERGLLRRELDE